MVNYLKNKVCHVKLQILFLIETKLNEKKISGIRVKCGFAHGIDASTNGSRGGLSLVLEG